jgi:arabinogalactan endo-1,4-beta-galactosidase
MDVWTSDKLHKIRNVVDRCFKNEKWELDPDNKFLHSHSCVDLFKILYDTFDKVYDIIGIKYFARWHKTIRSMMDDIMFSVITRIIDDISRVPSLDYYR